MRVSIIVVVVVVGTTFGFTVDVTVIVEIDVFVVLTTPFCVGSERQLQAELINEHAKPLIGAPLQEPAA